MILRTRAGKTIWKGEAQSIREALGLAIDSGADLRDADLRGAVLRYADLRDANLREADLREANLREADLREAFLAGADLRGANLRGANLREANLREADLGDADLRGAFFGGANLPIADLGGADLGGADLGGADLGGADLGRATMPDDRVWEEYRADHLAGICDDAEVRGRAVAAWGAHTWTDCPMHVALGISSVDAAPADKRLLVGAWVALYDSGLLDRPQTPARL